MVLENKKTGIVFGVFDGLHPGHEFLITESLKLCHELIVVLTLAEPALVLKGRIPKASYKERERDLKNFSDRITVIPSDVTPGKWTVFKQIKFNPKTHTVILGYDQTGIASELNNLNIPYITLPSFHPEKYKSSLLSKD